MLWWDEKFLWVKIDLYERYIYDTNITYLETMVEEDNDNRLEDDKRTALAVREIANKGSSYDPDGRGFSLKVLRWETSHIGSKVLDWQ